MTDEFKGKTVVITGATGVAAVFLASSAASYVTGTSLSVDGGGSIPRRGRVS